MIRRCRSHSGTLEELLNKYPESRFFRKFNLTKSLSPHPLSHTRSFLSLKVTPKLSYAPKTIISKQAKPKSNGSVRVRKNLLIRGWIKERRKITPKHGIWAYYIGSYDRDQSNFVAFNVALVVACLYSSRRLDGGAVWFRSYHVFFVSN